MVRLHTSLLALIFATGLVLASSDDYQRRDEELFERDLDVEEFFGRQYDLLDERSDTFVEPEARGLIDVFKIGEKIFSKGGSFMKGAKTAGKLEDYRERAKKIGQRQKPASRSSYIPMVGRVTFRSRGLEDDEELLRRDLDSEEVFGREYDLFDERDTFDDLD